MLGIIRRLKARIRYRRFDDELAREIAVHRAMLEEEARAQGAPPDAARHGASRRRGNVALAREAARGVWIAPAVEGVWQDVRYALRSLRASPGFTIPALAVLIVTMGLVTTVYTAAEWQLFRPWPLPDADRVVGPRAPRGPGAGGAPRGVGGAAPGGGGRGRHDALRHPGGRQLRRQLPAVAGRPGLRRGAAWRPGAAVAVCR
jgi:hypothetical protein